MDQETRVEIEKIHGRISDLKGRVVHLEAQQPHTSAALARIEKSVERLNGYLSKAAWMIFGLFFVALWRLVSNGSVPGL